MSENDLPVSSESEEEVRASEELADESPRGSNGSSAHRDGSMELSAEDAERLRELDEDLEKFLGQKRWSDVIKTTLAKADLVVDVGQKVELLLEAGRMYLDRSPNQGAAISTFRRVLELDGHNLEAIERLKQLHENRRDFTSLIEVMRIEAELLDPEDQAQRRLEIAQLATKNRQKPALCIELWQDVLHHDEDNLEALEALKQLFERARDFEAQADVLERLSRRTDDASELATMLQKLGMIYADKLKNDEGAIDAFKRLLLIDPDDRRAQEQLKKRFVAAGAWEELEEFYAATGKWDELIRTLERAADAKDAEVEERVRLLFRVARLWLDQQQKPDRAARAYEKVFALEPDNLEAAEALTPIYEEAGDAKKLVNVYEVRLQHLSDPDQRVMLLRESGLLYEEKLRNPQRAFECFLEAFSTDSGQEVLRDDLERLAGRVKDWDKLFSAYAQAIENATHPDDVSDLRLHYGKVLIEAGNTEEAMAQYRAVYDDRPDDERAMQALESLYRETESYAELLEILRRRAEYEADPETRRKLAYDVARLYEEQLQDIPRAVEAYRAIPLEFGEEEADAYRALERLYEQGELWDDLASTLEHRIDLGPGSDEELASLKFRLGQVLLQHGSDKVRALDLYREVLLLMPEHDGALQALEGVLSDSEVGAQAAAVLEPVYEAQGEADKLVQALEASLVSVTDPDQRVDVITKIGELHAERLGDTQSAFDAYSRALRERPDSPGISARLQGLATELGKLEQMVKLLSELAGEASDPDLGRQLWVMAATIRDEELGDVDGAVGAYMHALELDEGDPALLSALEALYRRAERWRELLSILRKKVTHVVDPSEQEEVLSQMAFIHDEMLSEPREAIRIYNEILELDPTSEGALSALDGLYSRQEMWPELADNINRQLSLAEDEETRIRLMLTLGEVRELRMDAVDSAIEIYREVLDRDPACGPALSALERLLERPQYQVAIAEVLEPLYRDSQDYGKLVGVHEIQVAHADNPDRRVELLTQMAELHEVALDDLGGAFNCFARALSEDASDPNTQEQLERIASSTGAFQKLAEVYEERVRDIEDPLLAATLHARAADIREARLGDVEGAIGHYGKVLELDDANVEAADALERLFHMAERYSDLALVYLKKAAMLTSPSEQRDYFFRAGALYDEILDEAPRAVEVYKQSLGVEPDDFEAIDKLIGLYLKLERWEDLLESYSHKADIVDDPELKKALYAEVGAVYEQRLGAVDKAIETYQRVLEIDPTDMTAMARLDVLYQSTESWEELLSIVEREADLAGDPDEAVAFKHRIGELFELRLGDAYRAAEVYRELLDVAPDHAPTLQALERMIENGKEPVFAAQVLEPIYRGAGESAKLVAVLEVLVAHEDDPIRKVELLHQLAELHEVHLDQPRLAFDAHKRALPCDNENGKTLAALEQFAERLGAFDELAALYDGEIRRLQEESPDSAVDLALRLAKIFEVQIGDVESAIVRYRIVFEVDSGHQETLAALDRLYTATERWNELAEVIEREIEVAVSSDDVLDLQYRLGVLQQERLGNVEAAIEQYKEILASAPEHDAALGALEGLFNAGIEPARIGEILDPLYRMQDAWDKLVGLQERILLSESDPVERVLTMHRIAETAEQRMGDFGVAFTWMQRASMEDPTHDHSVLEVERLAGIVDGWPVLASTYAQILESGPGREVAVQVGKRLARLYQEELGDIARAEEAYRYVVAVDEGDDEVLAALDRIYSENGAGSALAETLRKRVAASDGMDKVELLFRLGNVLYDDVNDAEEAIKVFRALLEEEPEHEGAIRALQNIYIVTQQWDRLLSAYEKELDVVVGDSEQAEILGKMAVLAWTKLGNLDRAVELLRRVLDLLGEDPEALNALGNIFAVQENWADLVDVLEREVAVSDDDSMRLRLYSDLGRIWYERLKRDRNALESWERALDIDPSYADALFAIAEIHRNAEAYPDLVDTLHRVIDVGAATLDDATIESVYMRLGAIYDQHMDQPAEAVESFGRALELNPRNFGAMDALERIHAQQMQWDECIEVMNRRVDALEDPQGQINVLLSIARMWEEQLEARESAVAPFTRILAIDPLHDFAFAQLEELYRAQGRFDELIELYIARVEASESADERVALLRKVADVNEKDLDDKNQAFDALQLAWTQDFLNDDTATELERMAGLTQRWNELLTTANESLQQMSEEDVEIRNAVCVRAARWYAREGHPDYAIPYLQQVLTHDPLNLPAIKQMAELYRQTQQWQIYGQLLNKLSEMTEDKAERAEVYVRMGELNEEQFNSAEQAITHYRDALTAVPTHLGALKALDRIYRARGEWSDLIEILKRKVAAVEDPEQVLEAKLELAEAFEDRVSDKTRAVEQYRSVLEEDPENLQALKGLERLFAQQERWHDLLEILERQLDLVTNERDRVELLTRIAAMQEEEFLKHDKAAERLEQVVDLDPTNGPALQGLARLYRHTQRWDDLINTYERHVAATPDRVQKVELFLAIGAVYRDELKDPDRAIDAFLNVTGIDDDHRQAIEALADLYQRRGEHSMALDAMERLSALIEDPAAQVRLLHRMGKLYDSELADRMAAVEHFQRAIDIDNAHLPSLEAMRDIHVDEGDWRAAVRVIEQATQVETNSRRGAELRVDLGCMYRDRLSEPERAIECFEDAIKLDPDSAGAARPLIDHYMDAERFADAGPLLRMLVHSSELKDPSERQRYWFLYGKTADATGDLETAIKAYSEAFEQDSQDLPSLMGLAAAYFRQEDWENAHKFYQMLLVHRRDELGTQEITETLYKLGTVKRKQGELRKALNMFDKALEEDPLHEPTLVALIEVHSEQKDYEQVIHFKKQLLECVDPIDQRFRLFEEIGELWHKQLNNAAMAIEAYVEASTLDPSNHKMLHKLLELYTSTQQWESAIDTIDRISELEDRPEWKAKYANAIATILRDELKDADAALERFNQALDLDPTGALKAFEAVNKILTQKKDWKQLERAFRKMLHRVTGKGDTALEFTLWHSLGVIYRDRLKTLESAAEAFAMASRLQPDDMQEHVILAEIYGMVPDRFKEAIAEHQILLRNDPYRVDSYRQLYKLYFGAREYDKAWCVAATLNFLKKADQEQRQFYEQYKQDGPIRPKSRLTNERWVKDLFHPDEDFLVGKLFEAVAPAVLQIKQQPDKTWQLRKKDQVSDLSSTTATFPRMFGFATQVLALPFEPRLFVCPDRQGGLAYATTMPPASVCGSALLTGINPLEVIFVVGKHLTYYRPEHFIRTMFQTKDELKLVLAAAMQIAGVGISDPTVEKTAQQIGAHMQQSDRELLRSIGKRFVEAGARADIKRWIRLVEITGCRAGFLLCNNLEIASRMIQREPPMGAVDLTPKEKVEELVLFSVSEEYFRLREAIGIQIAVA